MAPLLLTMAPPLLTMAPLLLTMAPLLLTMAQAEVDAGVRFGDAPLLASAYLEVQARRGREARAQLSFDELIATVRYVHIYAHRHGAMCTYMCCMHILCWKPALTKSLSPSPEPWPWHRPLLSP